MSAAFEDLRMLKSAEEIADSIWMRVVQWDEFAKDVFGLTALARQLNTFTSGLKTVRAEQPKKKPAAVRESAPEYITTNPEEFFAPLFSEEDFNFLNS